MRAFFREITETVPSLFLGIFSERNSVPNPNRVEPAFPSFLYQVCDDPDLWDVEEGGLYPTIARINHSCSPNATWSYTLPSVRYGKLTVLPQPLQIRVSFFRHGCWTSGMCMRMNSKTPLPGLTTLAAQMPPGAIPCPLLGKLWKGSTGSARPQFQIRVSFFLYGCWTSRMCMRMASIPPLPGLTTLAALTPPGATPCPP